MPLDATVRARVDLLVIYLVENVILKLVRMGKHNEIFN